MKRRLRVGYLSHRFPYLTETFVMREIYWIREHDVEVHIFSLLNPEKEPIHEQARELLPYVRYSPFLSWEVIKAQIHFLRRSPTRYLRALAGAVAQTYREPGVLLRALVLFPKSVLFARQIEELGIDHLHAHFAWLEGIAANVTFDLLGIPFTITPHAFDLFERDQRDVRRELEKAAGVIAISAHHRDYIASLCPKVGPERIHVIHCGLEVDRFHPVPRQPEGGRLRILSVGRLVEKKGHQHLIEACALLEQRGLDFQCDIVGSGALQGKLQDSIDRHGLGGQVSLLGALGQAEILELYQRADIFALPCVVAASGDRDGIPVALMEAMACELPVVTTPVAGIPELVRDGETGLLVREGDADQVAAALERLIADPVLRRRLGEEGRRAVLEGFQVQRNAARLASVFREVTEGRQRTMLDGVAAPQERSTEGYGFVEEKR